MDAHRRWLRTPLGFREVARCLRRRLGAQTRRRQAQLPASARARSHRWIQPLPRLRSGSEKRRRRKSEIRNPQRSVRRGARRVHLARAKVQLHPDARIALLSAVTVRLTVSESRKVTREFYARPVLLVARECIGKILVHRAAQGIAAGRIVEVEAYRGPRDLAAHSARGLTKRTAA